MQAVDDPDRYKNNPNPKWEVRHRRRISQPASQPVRHPSQPAGRAVDVFLMSS
jgi:hypothetical protein